MIKFLHYIINVGVNPANSIAKNRQLRVVNTVACVGGSVSLIFGIINIFGGNWLLAGINACTAICVYGLLYFNSRGQYELGPLISMSVCSLQFTASSLLFNNNMEFYLLLIICLALVLLDDARVMATLIVFNILLFLVAWKLAPHVVVHQATENRRFVNLMIWLCLLMGCLYFFRSQIMSYLHELETKNRQLDGLNKTKEKLFSVIAHDMRSPIASLGASLDLLNEQVLSQEEFADFSGLLTVQLKNLQDNLDVLLQWSHSQLKGIEVNPVRVDVGVVVEEVLVFLRPLMQQKSIALEWVAPEQPVVVVVDRDHLHLILRNLLSNAIKFSYPYGTIAFSLHTTLREVLLGVHDFGTGMTPEIMANLFISTNIHSTSGTQNEKGIGLGLGLSQEFAQKNGGRITVQSTAGKGSSFILHLPVGQKGDS